MRNSNVKFESPFTGFPVTTQVAEPDGTTSFHVTPRTLTPLRAKIADGCATLSALFIAFCVFLYAAQKAHPVPWLFAMIPAFCVSRPLFEQLYRPFFRTDMLVVFTADEFRVQHLFGAKVYDRQLPHKFQMIIHDEARSEREINDLKVRKAQLSRKAILPRRYFDDSYHIVLSYAGQRVDIMTVFDRRIATEVLARFQACDEAVEAQRRKGSSSIAFKPSDEWGDQPCQIPG